MKYKIKKAEFDALNEDLKKEYNLEGDEASLRIEDGPDFEALEKKRSIEAEHRKTAETKLAEAEKRESKLKKDLLSAGGDEEKIKQIEAKHQLEIDKLRDEREAETKKLVAERNQGLISEVASKFAADRFTVPGLISDQFAKRLNVEDVNGQPVVRVIDANGNASTASIDDLQKEFLDNKDYLTIIKANTGSGGGAIPGQNAGSITTKLSEMSVTEQVKFEKENPDGFATAIKAESV